jgi:uncharacterized protein YjbI with pentapeptide repeats
LTPHRSSTVGLLVSPSTALLLCCTTALLISPAPAHADIYQWEYINPADPSQGKQQSTTLAPDGVGVDAVPGADLRVRNLTMAYLIGADVERASFYGATLTDADLRQANLTNSDFYVATLNGANLTGAEVRGARFRYTNFTAVQLYSTASYQSRDLTGIGLGSNSLDGWNFAGQNLTDASFFGAWMADADFTGADVRGATFAKELLDPNFYFLYLVGSGITPAQLYSTASYRAQDLSGIDLSYNGLAGANLNRQKLTHANFHGAQLTDADFTDAEVQGANFTAVLYRNNSIRTGITLAQLYSTASYQDGDLNGVDFSQTGLAEANFAGQNLTNANFYRATLTGADFAGASVRGANFGGGDIGGCDRVFCFVIGSGITPEQLYSTASYKEGDLRGISGVDLSGADTNNIILPSGHVAGLHLDAGAQLVVRDYGDFYDYYGNPLAFPITVDQHLTMGPGGTLRIMFEADAWDSTISFATGIPVTLGGTLELTFADDVNLASQVGRTFDLFDWTGVNPVGAFAVSSPYAWDLSNLYTTGEVTLTAVPEPALYCSSVLH